MAGAPDEDKSTFIVLLYAYITALEAGEKHLLRQPDQIENWSS